MALEDVCQTFTSGGTPSRKKPEFFDEGTIPWVKTKELNDELITTTEEFITDEALRNSSVKLLPKGTVLLAMYGATVGKLGILGIEATCNQACAAMVPKEGVADSRFLFYLLTHHREQIIAQATGGAQQNLSGSQIRRFSFDFPPIEQQRQIAETLWLMDQKIGVNNQVAQTLENVAASFFKSWFIDFDPVKAKMAGETPVGMDAETAALFPDSIEEGGSVDLPSGWSSVTIADLCASISNGSTPKRSVEEFWENPVIDWYKTGELRDNFLLRAAEGISETGIESSSVRVMPGGTVLMAIYAAPTVGRLGILTEDSVFNQACTGLVPRPEIGTAFLYMTLKHLRPFFIRRSNGAAQQNISKLIVESAPCIRAPREIQEKFNELVSPIFELWESLTKENARLSEIRDSLLPRLISGELEIPDEMLAA